MTGARPRSTAAPAVDCRVLAVLRDAVLVVDLDGLVTYCNPAAEQMLGLPREDVLGTPASSLYGMRPDPALRREMIESLVRTGGWMGDVTLAPTPQRAAAVVNVHTSAVYDEAGLLTGAVAVVRDVTARRSVESEGRVLRAEVQQMLEVAPIGLCLTGTDGRVLRANDRLCRILGYPPEELVGMTYQEFTHPDDVSDSHEQVQRLLKGDGSARFEQEKRYLRGDGGEVWVRVTASLMRDEAGRPSHFVTAVEDISERKSASERLAAVAAAQLEIAGVELSPQKVMHEICRHARTLTGADGAAVQMLEDEELVVRAANGTMVHGVGLRLVLDDISGPAVKGRQVMTSPDTANDPRLTREAALAARRGHARSAVVAPLLRGDDVLGVLTVSATRPHSFTEADAQTLTLLAAPFGAALANAWHLEQVAHRAATDPLTGLPNRTRVLRSLEQALQRLPPEGGSAVALLFLDLDGFKAVNDTHGHEPGDRVLREVAERISGVVRGRDVAGRLGGDEFCVVCSDLTGAADAEALARRLVQAVSGAYCVSGDGPEPRAVIGVSVGVAIAERNCRPRDVVRAADELMYAAKQAGGNRYRVGGVSGPAGTPARD